MGGIGNGAIEYVQIFGERCSGTNYLASLIDKNFDQVVLTRVYGGKHWFIKDHDPRGRANDSTDHECLRNLSDSRETLFVVIYRDPLDWLRSLHAKPYHARHHAGLSFSEFIRKPWISFETARVNPFWPKNRDYYFIEEAENVLRLRTLKIAHLNRLKEVVEHVVFINYERLAADHQLIGETADRFGIRLRHRPLLGEASHVGGTRGATFTGGTRYPPIAQEDLEYIRRHLDWDVESSIGYTWNDGRSVLDLGLVGADPREAS